MSRPRSNESARETRDDHAGTSSGGGAGKRRTTAIVVGVAATLAAVGTVLALASNWGETTGAEFPDQAVAQLVRATDLGDTEAANEVVCAERRGDTDLYASVADMLASYSSYSLSYGEIERDDGTATVETFIDIDFGASFVTHSFLFGLIDEDGWKVCDIEPLGM